MFASLHSVFSFILYIYSSVIRNPTIWFKKSNSLAYSLTVSSSSSFLSWFSLCISRNSASVEFNLPFSFLMIFLFPSTSSYKELYFCSLSSNSSSLLLFSSNKSSCLFLSSSSSSYSFLYSCAYIFSFSSRALPPMTSLSSIS